MQICRSRRWRRGEKKMRTSNKHLNFMFSQHNSHLEKYFDSGSSSGSSSRWKSWSNCEWKRGLLPEIRKRRRNASSSNRIDAMVNFGTKEVWAQLHLSFSQSTEKERAGIFCHWAMQITAATSKLFSAKLFALVLKRLIFPWFPPFSVQVSILCKIVILQRKEKCTL